MKLLGVVVVLGGWLLAVSGLFVSAHNMVRAIFAVAGIAVSLTGSLGILNKHFLAEAIWKKQ